MQEEDPLGSFNYNYVKAVQHFEMLALEGQELNFHHFKLQVNGNEDNQRVVESLREIEPGMNTLISIRFHIVRVIRFEHCTYMLATTYKPYNKHTLAVLVSVNSKTKKQSTILEQCFMPKVQIKVSNVFCRQGENQFLPQLIFLSDYVKITQTSPSQSNNSTSDQLREQANIFFKNKKYVQAIIKYQQSLAHILGPSPRNRSILYSNASACFYQLRLYNSCSIYADLAILIDPFYNKAYYRKIHSYLQMKKYNETLPLLSKIYPLINRADFQKLNAKYTHYIASETGIVNWSNIFKGKEQLQGEYISSKITKIRTQNEIIYYAKQNISQYQLILIAKPLIYIKQTGHQFKESFIIFLKEIENYYLYDDHFQQSILFLPCKCHPTYKSRKDFYKHHKNQAKIVHKKQLFNKMQRCIFQQKSLDKKQSQNGYGIWKQMFYFQNKCNPNCTGVHINSSYIVNAVTNIQKGTALSIDLIADVDSAKRHQTLSIKFDTRCECKICEFKQSSNIQFNKIQQLYDRFESYQLSKKKKQHIWAIINYQWQDREVLEEQFAQLIYYYIYVIEKECQWDDILNLLRLKQENSNVEINNHIDQSLKRLISKLLSIPEKDIQGFYDHVIENYIGSYEEDV